ncbi:FadR/GntR family transcriptional regulator [Microbacterium amylolyticum]|uniref:DNA-binding FadR family transcriptional regulator n=1 Tax=Microbacterium amylolyticum TaxID=936337 RepID=A0ABS4ZKE2_9MICO|nr:FCD domain-containing protein [Microbacterium amylolyticum]MBP2437468.1 DNA-binding FadR family transcriptional regulator [Microbacterium amylolyticum]
MAEQPKAWRTVLDHVERRLRDGSLGPGDRLPGERDLAADLGVGRSSVREAVRVLEVMGVIRTATGSGPRAGAIVTTSAGSGVAQVLGLHAAAQAFAFGDVVDTRLVLEQDVVRMLAERRTPTGAAEEILAAMDHPDLDPAEFLALDAQFHNALAEATGNAVISTIMTGLRAAIETYVQAGAGEIRDWSAMRARLQEEHRGVIAAIHAGESGVARDRIHDHISGYYAATQHTEE